VAIFETGYAPVSSVGTVSSIIFASGSVTTTASSASPLSIIVVNQGANTVYVGGGSAASTTTLGVPLTAGQELCWIGGTTAITLWGNTGVVGQTSNVQTGLGSLVSVA
jgi:hypothetical protein